MSSTVCLVTLTHWPKTTSMSSALACLFACLLLVASPCSALRDLKQASTENCKLLHPQCTSCEPQTRNGTSTDLVCTACTPPQYMTVDGSCGCSAGFFSSNATTTTCEACGQGAYCSGGPTNTATRVPCGPELTTNQQTAANATACITLPGFAYMSGVGTAVECPAGAFNMGGNQKNCTICPAGLTTAGNGSTNIDACSAPPGYLYRNRQALPCSKGTYKGGINKDTACKECPAGTTTKATAATTAADCSVVLPGYRPLFDGEGQAIGAQPCPIGTFSSAGQQCDTCPEDLTTQQPKQTSEKDCLAPPGFGYYPNKVAAAANASNAFMVAALNATNSSTVVSCPSGSYKAGWNRDACVSCGVGFLTEPVPATSPDHCYLPPGYGSKYIATSTAGTNTTVRQLVAVKCMNGTYGSDSRHYGLEPQPCQPCPENTATPDVNPASTPEAISTMLMTSINNCSNTPGYGWQHGVASQCQAGFYSPGFDLNPCTACNDGLTTSKPLATQAQDCVAQPGWELAAVGTAQPCRTGTYSPGGPIHCQACPQGSTTSGPAATSATDCNVCLPGWGSSTDLGTSSQDATLCTPCTPGFYSAGGTADPCAACQAGYTSPARALDSTACYAQWSSMAPYNCIANAAPALVAAEASTAGNGTAAAPTDINSCQAACGALNGCQFWVFREQQLNPADNGCWLKLQAALPTPDTYLAYKLGTGGYATWPADHGADAQLGNSVEWTSPDGPANITPQACLDACDAKAACLGTWLTFNFSSTSWTCKLMAGEYRDGVSSTIQAVPQRINDYRWAKDCIGAWVPSGECSRMCGGGTQQATYLIIQPVMEDGIACEAMAFAYRSQPCNLQPCAAGNASNVASNNSSPAVINAVLQLAANGIGRSPTNATAANVQQNVKKATVSQLNRSVAAANPQNSTDNIVS